MVQSFEEEFKVHYAKFPSIHTQSLEDTMAIVPGGSGNTPFNDASFDGSEKRVGGRPHSPKKRFVDGAEEFDDSFDGGFGPASSNGTERRWTGGEESIHGRSDEITDEDNTSGDVADLAITLAITTFWTITGKDVAMDMVKVEPEGNGPNRLFLLLFQDIPWSTSYFQDFLTTIMAQKSPFPFMVKTAKEISCSDASLFLQMSVMNDKLTSFLDRIESFKVDTSKAIMASDFKFKKDWIDLEYNQSRSQQAMPCFELFLWPVALFDTWMYIRVRRPEVIDESSEEDPGEGINSDATEVKHDQIKLTAEMIPSCSLIQKSNPMHGMMISTNSCSVSIANQ